MKGPNVDASKKEKIHVRVRVNKLKSQIGKFHDNQKVSNL